MKKFCMKCGREVEVTLKSKKEDIEVKDTIITIDSNVYYCNECGTELWDDIIDDENLLKAFNKYREIKGLLFPDQIKEIRNKYGLSQRSFAKVLGLGEKTITRYESGSLQDMAQNNLIALMDDVLNFKRLWERSKKFFSAQEINNVEECLERYNYKTTYQNGFGFMIGYKEYSYYTPSQTTGLLPNIIYYPTQRNEVTICR